MIRKHVFILEDRDPKGSSGKLAAVRPVFLFIFLRHFMAEDIIVYGS